MYSKLFCEQELRSFSKVNIDERKSDFGDRSDKYSFLFDFDFIFEFLFDVLCFSLVMTSCCFEEYHLIHYRVKWETLK